MLSEVLTSLAWEAPICFFRMAQRSCTICWLYSDVSDTPQKSKKILGDYVSATVSYPERVRSFLEFGSESACPCVHRAMRIKQFTVYVLELRQCTVFFLRTNANFLHTHMLTGPVKASTCGLAPGEVNFDTEELFATTKYF